MRNDVGIAFAFGLGATLCGIMLVVADPIEQTNVGGNTIQFDTGQSGSVTVRLDAHCYCEQNQCPPVCPTQLTGPGRVSYAPSPWCRLRDVDGDGDVDLRDFKEVQ